MNENNAGKIMQAVKKQTKPTKKEKCGNCIMLLYSPFARTVYRDAVIMQRG